MNKAEFNDLSAELLRRRLTTQEERQVDNYLAEHPESKASWEEDLELALLLTQPTPAPVSSNFTNRVLEAVEVEERAARRSASREFPKLRSWWRGFATAGAALVVSIFVYQQYQTAQREALAKSLELVSGVTAAMSPATRSKPTGPRPTPPLPSLEMLQDFEAINHLGETPAEVDLALLAAIQ